ncbi:MAG TPA: sigma-54 dependent transcriptional regulator [Thermoanaerobaculia bacterium]|nr:sigma-54 dependent transcriptional regulator [Thermoanaerobaculia bacterium]
MIARERRVLVVEDRDSLRRLLARGLRDAGFVVADVASVAAARELLSTQEFDCVFTDLRLPDGDGLEVLRASHRARPEAPVVVLTGYGSVQSAVEAMKAGASDFLEKPVELDELVSLARAHTGELAASPATALELESGAAIVGRHPRLRAALRLLRKVAPTESTVLLLGESGTGKELFARALHELSPRHAGPFVAFNCAAIPEPLMENELFGHEKGSFTGATARQVGRFEQATGGTLVLDEVGELDLAVQAKVLRVLEERAYQRIGGEREIQADVRLVAATNRDLRRAVADGTFRADLYYRLDVFPIELPPLRDRPEDVPELAEHLLRRAAHKSGRTAPTLSRDAAALLAGEVWPGNVRQLANVLERAAILCEGAELRAADLEPLIEPLGGSDPAAADPETAARARVREALLEAGGNKTRAAELLGISYRTLLRRVRAWDLEGFPKYRD